MVDGTRILLAYYNGKQHHESGRRTRIHWPPVGNLPTVWWKTWQAFLVRWCGTALRLFQPLRAWYKEAEMLTQCCFFMHENRLIMQHDKEFFEFAPFTQRSRTRFQTEAFPFNDMHLLDSVPEVDIAYKSGSIFVISSSALRWVDDNVQVPTITVFRDMYRDLPPDLQRLFGNVEWPSPHDIISIAESVQEGTAVGVSDGSVRTSEGKASQAWKI